MGAFWRATNRHPAREVFWVQILNAVSKNRGSGCGMAAPTPRTLGCGNGLLGTLFYAKMIPIKRFWVLKATIVALGGNKLTACFSRSGAGRGVARAAAAWRGQAWRVRTLCVASIIL